jgi:FAD binding domain/Berberine and berberine like
MKRRTFCTNVLATSALSAAPWTRLLAAAAEAATSLPAELAATSLAGAPTTLSLAAIRDLRAKLRGELLIAGDEGYDTARRIWNAMIDRRPALIARCASPSDIVQAIGFAREHDLLVAVRGGGHSLSGQSVCDGGIMIDCSPMQSVRVDPIARTARIEPGVLLGALDRESQFYGLATTAGTVSHTGAAGLTLGGGQGRLQRKFGLACDNLLAADVITAKGQFVRASEKENADLFWGLRGGGGNFGIVTSFEYRLHPFGPKVLAGPVIYPFEQAKDLYKFYADFTATAPDELHLVLAMVSPTGGKPLLSVDACYAGDIAKGERVLEPLRRFGKPIADQIKVTDYITVQQSADKVNAPGQNFYAKSGFLPKLDSALIDAIVDGFRGSPNRATVAVLQQFGGAMGRVREDATAYPDRRSPYEILVLGGWRAAEHSEENLREVKAFWAQLKPLTQGFYINTTALDEMDRVRANYGRNYDRLVQLKNKYDPTNVFRLNANIRPSA